MSPWNGWTWCAGTSMYIQSDIYIYIYIYYRLCMSTCTSKYICAFALCEIMSWFILSSLMRNVHICHCDRCVDVNHAHHFAVYHLFLREQVFCASLGFSKSALRFSLRWFSILISTWALRAFFPISSYLNRIRERMKLKQVCAILNSSQAIEPASSQYIV